MEQRTKWLSKYKLMNTILNEYLLLIMSFEYSRDWTENWTLWKHSIIFEWTSNRNCLSMPLYNYQHIKYLRSVWEIQLHFTICTTIGWVRAGKWVNKWDFLKNMHENEQPNKAIGRRKNLVRCFNEKNSPTEMEKKKTWNSRDVPSSKYQEDK